MSSPQDDKDLDDYLRGESELSRRYRALSQEEPPAALDRLILEQARARNAGDTSNVAPLRRGGAKRWAVPFGLAATMLLSFAILRERGVQTEVSAPAPATLSTTEMTEKQADAAAVEPARQREAESDVAAEAPQAPARTFAADVPPPQAVPSPVLAPETAEATRNEVAQEQRAVARMRAAPAAAQPAATAGAAALQETQRRPEEWLEAIRALRMQDELAADRELERFLEAHPGYFEQNPAASRP